ncbi:hypothetical protein ACWGOQ_0023895, partial [Aquimarina sp. M1]
GTSEVTNRYAFSGDFETWLAQNNDDGFFPDDPAEAYDLYQQVYGNQHTEYADAMDMGRNEEKAMAHLKVWMTFFRMTEEVFYVLPGSAAGAMARGSGRVFSYVPRYMNAAKRAIEVSEASIMSAIEGSTMKTLQGKVSLPMIERYVKMLQKGNVAPPIKVSNGVIIEGNHRYISGRLFGKTPGQIPGTMSRSDAFRIKPIQQTIVSPLDWGGF